MEVWMVPCKLSPRPPQALVTSTGTLTNDLGIILSQYSGFAHIDECSSSSSSISHHAKRLLHAAPGQTQSGDEATDRFRFKLRSSSGWSRKSLRGVTPKSDFPSMLEQSRNVRVLASSCIKIAVSLHRSVKLTSKPWFRRNLTILMLPRAAAW